MRYKDLVRLLMDAYEISERDSSPFEGRLKNFTKRGWPNGVNTGKGRPADYTPRMARDVALIVELMVLGITPERSLEIVKANYALLHGNEDGGPVRVSVPPALGDLIPRSHIILDVSRAWAAIEKATVGERLQAA